jgi:hypothetical protein
MYKYFVVLFGFVFTSCVAKESFIDPIQPKLPIISFDVVQKNLVVEQEIPNHLQNLLNKWFNEKVKINGLDGNMIFTITNFNQEISIIQDGKRVDASLSFKINLYKPTSSRKKAIEGTVSSFGTLIGNFTLSEFDTIINNTQTDLILRLSRDLHSNIEF